MWNPRLEAKAGLFGVDGNDGVIIFLSNFYFKIY
jgi:hypothetical protein